MTQQSRIDKGMWWDKAWTLTKGCTPVSEGCAHCWSASMSHIRSFQNNDKMRAIYGGVTDGGKWTGRAEALPFNLDVPFLTKKPKIFTIWNDLFHNDIFFSFIAAVFGVMAACPQHTFQILTKRPRRMLHWFDWVKDREQQGRELFPYDDEGWRIRQMLNSEAYKHGINMPPHHGSPWPLPNVWLGVTAENQEMADERILVLYQCPAAVWFVSAEPLLGPIGFARHFPYVRGIRNDRFWVIVGGETGPGSRPMELQWVRSIRDQCKAAGVPFFMKKMSGGAEPPADLMIREFPQ